MPVVRNMMVRAGADFSSITKQANKAKASMSSMKAGITRSCSAMKTAASSMKSTFAALGITLSGVALISFAKSAREAYQIQIEGETKLATVMRQRMGASAKEIQQIKDLCSAQQALGVIGDEVQLSGAQQLATFLKQTSSLNTLIPAMNNLIAQQKGLNATTEKAYMVGNMMGKAMQGQASALRRVGITFNDAEEKVLKYGRNFTFEPMNPYERRIIHTAIQEVEGVTSYSVGSDLGRRVVISLEEGVKPTHPSKGGYNRGGRGGQRGGRRPSGGPRRNSGAPKSDAPQRAPKTDAGAKGVSLYGKLN